MQKLMPESKEYWLNKGFSEEDSKLMAAKRKGGRSKWNPNYYILRGHSEKDAAILANNAKLTCPGNKKNRLRRFDGDEAKYKDWVRENCNLSKQNMLKLMSIEDYTKEKNRLGIQLIGKRPNDIEYWIDKGFSVEEATRKVIETQRRNSKRCPEYWIAKGHSINDAIIKVSENQNFTSLVAYKSRYGEAVGQNKYDSLISIRKEQSKRSALYWQLLGLSEDEAIEKVSDYQRSCGRLSPSGLTYWLNTGLSEEDALLERYNWVAANFANCIQYWLDRGFTESEAVKLQKQIQSRRGILGAMKQRYNHKSSLEVKFNKLTEHINYKIWTSSVRRNNGKLYFPDFEFENCFVEIYGDYWHGNPSLYGPNAVIGQGKIASEKWQEDEERIREITALTNKPVIVVWEEQFNNKTVEEKIKNEISKYF